MKRASKSIALVLITSASILQGCDDPSPSAQDSSGGDWLAESQLLADSPYYSTTQPSTQPSTQPYNRSHYYSHGYGGSHYWYSSSSGSSETGYSRGSSYGSSGVYNNGSSS